jgi:putative heme-binding domain-containing protein
MESLVLPSADIDPNFEGVAVLTKSGRLITGIRVNEDNFSIQLRDQETGRLLSYFKHELADIQDQKKSLMPENLVEQITVKELHDLFAYLMTLDGRPASPAAAK